MDYRSEVLLLKQRGPGSVSYYFLKEKKLLLIITLSGLFYNVGMIAGPWFDGQLAQYLYEHETITGREFMEILEGQREV